MRRSNQREEGKCSISMYPSFTAGNNYLTLEPFIKINSLKGGEHRHVKYWAIQIWHYISSYFTSVLYQYRMSCPISIEVYHYIDVIMSVASQITSVCSCADQRRHWSSASLAFVRGIYRSFSSQRHKRQKMFPIDDVIIHCYIILPCLTHFAIYQCELYISFICRLVPWVLRLFTTCRVCMYNTNDLIANR